MASEIAYAVDLVDVTNLAAAGTPVAGLQQLQCGDRFSDVLNFSMQVRPGYPLLDPGKVVRVKLQGAAVWAGIIERVTRNLVKAGEEAEENVVYEGRSVGAILDRMAMRPSMGFGVEPWGPSRVFSFAEVHFDASAWSNAVELGRILDTSAFWERGEPSGFPSLNTRGIACAGDTEAGAPQGYRYFVKDFPVDEDTACVIFVSMDNSGDLFLDSFQVISVSAGADTTEGLRAARAFTGFLTKSTAAAPTHRIAARVVNVPFGGGDPGPGTGPNLAGNPTRLLCKGFKVDEEGKLGDTLFETDATWKALATPDQPPGMTYGQIMGVIRNQQLATLTGLGNFTLGFTDTEDSG